VFSCDVVLKERLLEYGCCDVESQFEQLERCEERE